MSVERLAERVVEACRERGIMLATAESCTGGMIAAALTSVPGSSDVFDRGFVTYSNEAKHELLGVPLQHTVDPGAVSDLVAREMVEGAIARSKARAAISVTGIAGPGGGSDHKPVGLVHVGAFVEGEVTLRKHRFRDAEPRADRARIRQLSAEAGLRLLLEMLVS